MIDKEIIKEGIGEIPRLHDEILFFFIAHNHLGELICGSQHTATKTIIGREWLIPQLDEVIQQMKQGERSLIKLYHSPATKEFYDQYEIEIIRIGRKLNKPWHLEGEEGYNRALNLKQDGNIEIKQQNYIDSQNKYKEALNLIKQEYCDKEIELQIQLRSNLSLTYLKNKQYDECIKQATIVLQQQPQNIKLLHRRAVASCNNGDMDQAKQDLKLARTIDPQNEEIMKELQNVIDKEKNEKVKQQERAKKMLFGE